MLSFFQELLFAPGTSVVKFPLLPIIAMVPLFASAFSPVDYRNMAFFNFLKTGRSLLTNHLKNLNSCIFHKT